MMVVMSPKGNPVASSKHTNNMEVVMIQSTYRQYQIARVPSRRMVVEMGVFPRFDAIALL